MAKTQEKKKARKETQKIVYDKLSGAMEEFKKDLKEKKVASNLKKLSKLFAADIVKSTSKQNGEVKARKKKISRKKVTASAEVTENVPAS